MGETKKIIAKIMTGKGREFGAIFVGKKEIKNHRNESVSNRVFIEESGVSLDSLDW